MALAQDRRHFEVSRRLLVVNDRRIHLFFALLSVRSNSHRSPWILLLTFSAVVAMPVDFALMGPGIRTVVSTADKPVDRIPLPVRRGYSVRSLSNRIRLLQQGRRLGMEDAENL